MNSVILGIDLDQPGGFAVFEHRLSLCQQTILLLCFLVVAFRTTSISNKVYFIIVFKVSKSKRFIPTFWVNIERGVSTHLYDHIF